MTLDDHVFDIDLDIPYDTIYENFVHQEIVRCSGILEAKQHFLVKKCVVVSVEGCSLFVFLAHLNLMVSFIGINEGFKLECFQGFDLLVYVW